MSLVKTSNYKWTHNIRYSAFSLVIGIYCLITLILFFVVFMSSFKSNSEIFTGVWSLPKKVTVENYIKLVKEGYLTYFLNSCITMIASIAIQLLISSLAAYGLEKFKFKGSKLIYGYFLLGLMFPIQLGVIPLFNTIKTLHLYNTLLSIILINAAALSVPVFVLANFLKTIPDTMIEAAKIDGASEIRIYWQIMLPMMQPALGALIPLMAVGLWNEVFIPLVFLTKNSVKTVPLGILNYYSGRGFNQAKLGLVFTSVSISILPMLLVYLFGSNKIIDGITSGSIKQ